MPCAVIAEVGVNHDGDPELAHQLIDVAAAAGADYVKFQTFRTDAVLAADAPVAAYQRSTGATTQQDLVRRLELPVAVWAELAAHATEAGVTFISTPFDTGSADLLEEIGAPLFKVPSGELTNLGLLRDLARRGRPLLVSTGMSTLDEVATALDAVAAAPEVSLLHCVSAYPAPVEQANLRAIVTMRERFGVPVGWSDHTEGSLTALGAVALGASVLEKHITLDRTRPGPDHAASADPDGFAAYVRDVRALEAALGDGVKRAMPVEADVRSVARRSWHARRDLAPGTTLAPDDVIALRPGTGIAPTIELAGRTVARPVAAGAALAPDDLTDLAGPSGA